MHHTNICPKFSENITNIFGQYHRWQISFFKQSSTVEVSVSNLLMTVYEHLINYKNFMIIRIIAYHTVCDEDKYIIVDIEEEKYYKGSLR